MEKPKQSILGKLRDQTKLGIAMTGLALAPTLGKAEKPSGKDEIRDSKNITGVWKEVKTRTSTYSMIMDAPKARAFIKSADLPKCDNVPGFRDGIDFTSRGSGDHSIRRFHGKHSKACPGPENSAISGKDQGLSYDKQGKGYDKGVNEKNKLANKAKNMDLKLSQYLSVTSRLKSHSPEVVKKGNELLKQYQEENRLEREKKGKEAIARARLFANN